MRSIPPHCLSRRWADATARVLRSLEGRVSGDDVKFRRVRIAQPLTRAAREHIAFGSDNTVDVQLEIAEYKPRKDGTLKWKPYRFNGTYKLSRQ